MQIPIIAINVTDLGQCVLQDLIKSFDRSIFLRVIQSAFCMMNLKFFRQGLYRFIDKVRTSIAHQDFQTSKSSQKLVKDERCSGICNAVLHCLCLGPPSYIISRRYNVTHTCLLSRWFDRSDKISGPLVKCLQGHLRLKGNFIPAGWSSSALACIAGVTIVVRVTM